MLFIIEDKMQNVTVTDDHSIAHDAETVNGDTVLDRHAYKNFDDAQAAAQIANRADPRRGGQCSEDRDIYIATDGGEGLWPRYDVVRIPQVGDKVSVGFNGDAYPRGVIVSVGAGKRMVVTTDEGNKYNRFRKTGTWREAGNGWSLIHGHVNERNPSF